MSREYGLRALKVRVARKNHVALALGRFHKRLLQIAEQAVRPFDVLVTDVVMPQMSGQQLAKELLSTRPDLKVLFISGYTDNSLLRERTLGTTMTMLQKPFTPAQLVQKVRELLDTDQGRGPAQPSLPLTPVDGSERV